MYLYLLYTNSMPPPLYKSFTKDEYPVGITGNAPPTIMINITPSAYNYIQTQ